MKSAVFERQHGTASDALQVVTEALAKYPSFDKLYMIKGQILSCSTPPNISGAREAYSAGCKKCPTSVALWILASRLEEQAGMAIKARALLEKARFHNKKSDQIWLESVRVEERAGNIAQAKSLMSRGTPYCLSHPFCASLTRFPCVPVQQLYKNVQSPACYGQNRSGWKLDQLERQRCWMRSRKQTTTLW